MKRKYFEMAGKKYTLKQMKIISKLCDGGVHKQIAPELGISKGTLDHRVSEIFHKAGLPNAKALVAHAVAHGMQRGGRFNDKNLFVKVRTKTRKAAVSHSRK